MHIEWLCQLIFYMVSHLIFQLIHEKFSYDVVRIVVHVQVYDGVLIFSNYGFQKFHLWLPEASEGIPCPHEWTWTIGWTCVLHFGWGGGKFGSNPKKLAKPIFTCFVFY